MTVVLKPRTMRCLDQPQCSQELSEVHIQRGMDNTVWRSSSLFPDFQFRYNEDQDDDDDVQIKSYISTYLCLLRPPPASCLSNSIVVAGEQVFTIRS